MIIATCPLCLAPSNDKHQYESWLAHADKYPNVDFPRYQIFHDWYRSRFRDSIEFKYYELWRARAVIHVDLNLPDYVARLMYQYWQSSGHTHLDFEIYILWRARANELRNMDFLDFEIYLFWQTRADELNDMGFESFRFNYQLWQARADEHRNLNFPDYLTLVLFLP